MAAYLHRGRAAHAFTRWYIRHIYGPPFDAHIANSEYTAAELRRSLPDRDPGFIRVCPMGVDVTAFGPEHRSEAEAQRLKRALGLGAGDVLLFYAGRLSPEKNVPLLIEALRTLTATGDERRYGLAVAGDGPLAAGLSSAARSAGVRVTCAETWRESSWPGRTRAVTSSSTPILGSPLASGHSRPWRQACPSSCPAPVAC